MARKATLEGTRQRLAIVRTAIYNLERDLFLIGEDVSPYTEFDPAELQQVEVAEVVTEE